jgi:hypothetical protein
METYQNLKYQRGFGNSFETEAEEGVIPKRTFFNQPQIKTAPSN